MAALKLKLTKTTVAALPVPETKPSICWDTDLPGFGIRITPRGRRVFFYQRRTRSGRQVKLDCGTFSSSLTPDQARAKAKRYEAEIRLDRDPAAELKARRLAERERRQAEIVADQAATVADLWTDFERAHVASLRPASQDAYSTWYRLHVAPALGSTKLGALTRGKVAAALRAVAERAGRSTSNRVLAVLSAMLSYGEGATVGDDDDTRRYPECTNICRGIKRHAEPGRERDLSEAELARLISYLATSPATEARLLELALATGARRGELLGLRWSEISGAWWTIPAERSKSRKRQRKPLSAAALAVLAKLDPRADPFVELTASRLSRWWLAARAELQLDDVHLHDLRHAAASLAISAGVPLAAIGAMLGHGVNSAAMTARYSHLADRALADAAALVGDRLAGLAALKPAGHA